MRASSSTIACYESMRGRTRQRDGSGTERAAADRLPQTLARGRTSERVPVGRAQAGTQPDGDDGGTRLRAMGGPELAYALVDRPIEVGRAAAELPPARDVDAGQRVDGGRAGRCRRR